MTMITASHAPFKKKWNQEKLHESCSLENTAEKGGLNFSHEKKQPWMHPPSGNSFHMVRTKVEGKPFVGWRSLSFFKWMERNKWHAQYEMQREWVIDLLRNYVQDEIYLVQVNSFLDFYFCNKINSKNRQSHCTCQRSIFLTIQTIQLHNTCCTRQYCKWLFRGSFKTTFEQIF